MMPIAIETPTMPIIIATNINKLENSFRSNRMWV
jgi:hypothetical protein